MTAQETRLHNLDINPQEKQGTQTALQTYRKGPADTSEHPVDSENVDDVEEQNHNQVAHGDDLEVAVCTVIRPLRIVYTDECNQQRDLKDKKHVKGF